MNTVGQGQAGPVKVADDLDYSDLRDALVAGWKDFAAQPVFGIFFAGVYVIGGLFVGYTLLAWGEAAWLVPAAAGFPLIAPFVAVGLYEVSRRREMRQAKSWHAVLSALRGHGDEQILSMGVIVFVAFGFWLMVAHGVFAIFLAESGIGNESLALLQTTAGHLMLAVGSVIGAAMALAFYSITVISLPMLVDREVDFLTAIFTSLATVRSNIPAMLAWAGLIAVLLFVAMIPLFLGLLIVLPVLGHATWHLYRRAVGPDLNK